MFEVLVIVHLFPFYMYVIYWYACLQKALSMIFVFDV